VKSYLHTGSTGNAGDIPVDNYICIHPPDSDSHVDNDDSPHIHPYLTENTQTQSNMKILKILPQMNYLFSMLPVTPTDKWFKTLDTLISHFYWKNKTPKISLAKLQKTKLQGGLEAPNFQHYFLANQLQYMIKWINKNNYTKSWIDLEQNQCNSTSIADLPFLPTSIKKLHYFKNITITSTLTAWWKINKITNSSLTPSRHTPIWHNPDFQISNKPIYFPLWQQKGITHLNHLFQDNKFISFKILTPEIRYWSGPIPSVSTS